MTTTAAREDTRQRVLAVAVELIAEKGFAATSTREVCERMGFSKAALWYHFKSKDELLAAVVAPVGEDLSQLVSRSEPSLEDAARRRAVSDYVDLVVAHDDLARLIYDDPSLRRHPAIQPVRELWLRLIHLLAGTDHPDTEQRARARAALGALNAVLLRADADDDSAVLRDVALSSACDALGVAASPT